MNGGENCQTEPSCSSNPITCFSAKMQWKMMCFFEEKFGGLKELGNEVNSSDLEKDTDALLDKLKNGKEIDVRNGFNKEGLGWSRSCPSSLSLELGSHMGQRGVPTGVYCDWLKLAGDIIFGFSLLGVAFFILK